MKIFDTSFRSHVCWNCTDFDFEMKANRALLFENVRWDTVCSYFSFFNCTQTHLSKIHIFAHVHPDFTDKFTQLKLFSFDTVTFAKTAHFWLIHVHLFRRSQAYFKLDFHFKKILFWQWFSQVSQNFTFCILNCFV